MVKGLLAFVWKADVTDVGSLFAANAVILKLQAVLQIQFKITVKHDMHTNSECF